MADLFARGESKESAFLRFVFKNRNHNVFIYQLPTRFAGVTFLCCGRLLSLEGEARKPLSSPVCFQKPKPQCLYLSITYSLCRGHFFCAVADLPPRGKSKENRSLLRFVFKNRNHNVFFYQ
jgi:hypothetical protein